MNVSLVDLAPCKKLLKVEVDAQAVTAAINETIDLYQKNVTIRGFRAGKAPRETVAKLYEKAINDRTKQDLIEKGLRKAVEDNKLRTIGTPRLEEDNPLEADKPFNFNLTVELAPDFELPEYKGIPVTIEKNVVDDSSVDKAMTVLRERMCSYKDAAKAAENKDVVVINYHSF